MYPGRERRGRQPQASAKYLNKQYLTTLFLAGTPTKPKLRSSQRVLAACLLTLAVPCFASLGGDVGSVQSDQAHMQASLRVTQRSAYTLHQLQTPAGVAVREYVSPAGKVFAVAWHGPSRPDLKQLLGTHFDEFRQALQTRGPGHGPVLVQMPGLVVQLGGHMRDFVARAYLPDELPAGVRAEEIQ